MTGDEWPEFVTVQEVAGLLRVSDMSVYRMVKVGDLDTMRVGRIIRIHADGVRRLLKTGGLVLCAVRTRTAPRLTAVGVTARRAPRSIGRSG